MKKLFLIIFLLCISSTAHADIRRTIENAASTDTLTSINVPGTTIAYTKSISLTNQAPATSVGVMYKATSSGTINLSLQAERSYHTPTTEAVADSTYVSWNSSVTVNDNAWHVATLDTVVMPYLRFKISGASGNDNTTNIQIKVQKE